MMQRYADTVWDRAGNVIRNAAVRVYAQDGSPASLFDDSGNPLAQPLMTDDLGGYAFRAANGQYTVSIAAGGQVPRTVPVVLVDGLEALAAASAAAQSALEAQGFAEDAAASVVVTQYGVSTPTTAQALLRGETTTVPTKKGFWPNIGAGANIHRLRDRLMVGDGADSTGAMADAQGGVVANGADGANWAPRDSVGFFASRAGLMALTGFASNEDMDTTPGLPTENIGTAGFGIGRKAGRSVWGMYSDVQFEAGSYAYGIEIAVKNREGVDRASSPYAALGGTYGIWLPGGGDASYGGAPTHPSNTAIAIGKNASTWNKGLVFFREGLTGCDGSTGIAVAVEMAKGHMVQWLNPSNGLGALIRSDATTTGQGQQMVFGNRSTSILSAAGTDQWFHVYSETSTGGNGVRVRSRASGSSAVMEAISNTDATVALELWGKGTGTVDLAPGGAIQLRATAYSGATDFWEFKGGTSVGGGVQCNAQGADTNIPMVISTKGSGLMRFFSHGPFGAENFRIAATAGAVNMLQATGGASGGSPSLSVQGVDATADLILQPGASGRVRFGAHTANADAAISGYIEIKDASGNLRKLAVIN